MLVEKAVRRDPVPPLAARPPPILEADADLAKVLASDAVAIPTDDLDAFAAERERVEHLDLELRFAGCPVDSAGFSACHPDRVERFRSGRRSRLWGLDLTSGRCTAASPRFDWHVAARRKRTGTYPLRPVADDEVRVAQAILVLCDEVPAGVNLHDERSERFISVPDRFEQVVAPAGESSEATGTRSCRPRDLFESLDWESGEECPLLRWSSGCRRKRVGRGRSGICTRRCCQRRVVGGDTARSGRRPVYKSISAALTNVGVRCRPTSSCVASGSDALIPSAFSLDASEAGSAYNTSGGSQAGSTATVSC